MADICESSIEKMNIYMLNKSSTVVDFLAVDSKQALFNGLISFFSEKKIEKNEMNFDFLAKKISKWAMLNSENEIDLIFYVNSKMAHDDVFMSNISAAINNAIIMAFIQMNRTPHHSELINRLGEVGAGISFHFIKSTRKSRRRALDS